MLALLQAIVLTAPPNPCLEVRQLQEDRCIDRLVEIDFKNAASDARRLDRYPGVDPYSYAPELIAAPIPGLDFDQRYWRVCFQQLWQANRSAQENPECREPFERTMREGVARARVELEGKARRVFRRFRSRDGFGPLRWGMSESEVRARVPAAHPNSAGLASLGSQYGREAGFSYELLSDRLIRVGISIGAPSTQDAFDLFSKIAKTFEKQFGDPFLVGERVAWIIGQTRLELSMVNDAETHSVQITRHSLELETWALKLRRSDAPRGDDAPMEQSL